MKDKFTFHARHASGEFISGEIEAVSYDDALKELEGRGLFVLSLKETAQEEKELTHASKTVPYKYKRAKDEPLPPPASPVKKKIMLTLQWGALVFFGFFLVLLFRGNCASTPFKGNVTYKVIAIENILPGDSSVKEIRVKVPPGTGHSAIKLAARKAFDSAKEKNPALNKALFRFFYDNQDPSLQTAIGVLRWNWEDNGQWDYSFPLTQPADMNKGVSAKQVHYKRNLSVSFEFTIPSGITARGGEKMAEEKLESLLPEWKNKVEKIEADVISDGYSRPYMHCELETKKGIPHCRIITQ